jgi:hypothetical protein
VTDDVDGIGLIGMDFEVWGPGEVLLPEISVDGVPMHKELQAQFWSDNDRFVAAGSGV